jgi:hypothetical protein
LNEKKNTDWVMKYEWLSVHIAHTGAGIHLRLFANWQSIIVVTGVLKTIGCWR